MLNVAKEVSALERMTVGQLREKFAEVFGEPTNGRHREWLIKRIIWRMQANAEGDLTERARRRALELANDADLRMMPPRAPKSSQDAVSHTVVQPADLAADARLPMLGTILKRQYKGRTVQTTVLADGFEFEGEKYPSLSAVAKAITGTHWNGFHFWGLRKKGASA